MEANITEVKRTSDKRLIKNTENCIDYVFPEYEPTDLCKRFNIFQASHQKPSLQIFVSIQDNQVVSFVQVLYMEFDAHLFVDMDLLGTLPKYLRNGLASSLFSHINNESRKFAGDNNDRLAGLLTLIDPGEESIYAFHEKFGGQIRKDKLHQSGDALVWYPFADRYSDINTTELVKYMDNFGEMINAF